MPKQIAAAQVTLTRLVSQFAPFADGKFYEWKEGIDFTCKLQSLKAQADRFARKNEMRVEFGRSKNGNFCMRFLERKTQCQS